MLCVLRVFATFQTLICNCQLLKPRMVISKHLKSKKSLRLSPEGCRLSKKWCHSEEVDHTGVGISRF